MWALNCMNTKIQALKYMDTKLWALKYKNTQCRHLNTLTLNVGT